MSTSANRQKVYKLLTHGKSNFWTEVKPAKTKRAKKDEPPPDVIPVSQIDCRLRLGGLLKHYYRKVA